MGPSDVLLINVWRDTELSREVTVRPDGKITIPLVGDIRASGRTPSEIQDEIERRLKRYVNTETSRVTVGLSQIKSYQFTVAGNVARPGLYSSDNFMTVVEAVALAGGPNRFAELDEVVIMRPTPKGGRRRRIPINLELITNGQFAEQNIVVLRGDTIYIP